MLQSKLKWNFAELQEGKIIENHELDNLSPVIRELLLQRGIATKEEMYNFLHPNLDNLYSTSEIDMIDKAVNRIHIAIAEGEKILVYGDYDADGVCSTTLLLKTLQELGANCDFYIPNRFTEGYGPNEEAFRKAHDNDITLIITVDNGIAAVHEANIAKELGIDLIITDHHEIQEQLPDAYAIVHPKCSPNYSFQELAGVGVAFKLSEHLLGYFPKDFLDLVAIGTIADLVPLVSENRILAHYGLIALTTTKNIGLNALKQVCEIEGNVTEEDVGFRIGPRINAVGRLQNASLAVELLMTENQLEAEQLAEEIQSLNEERKKIVSSIVKEAEHMVEEDREAKVIIIAKEGWNEGVLGIVASRLVKKYDRPAIVLAINPETSQVKGSARSIPAFDLFTNCMKIKKYFTHFGGHSQAAGMSFPLENLSLIQHDLNQIIIEQLEEDDFKQVIDISKTLEVHEINEKLVNDINQLAPFGMDNPKPAFHLKATPNDIRQIGSLKKHLKLQYKNEDKKLESIGFNMGSLYHHISPQTPISIVGELSINEWNGYKKAQLIMKDLRIDQWQLFDHRGKRNKDIAAYCNPKARNLVIGHHKDSTHFPGSARHITYETDLNNIPVTDALYIADLPKKLDQLKAIIQTTMPINIHACYNIEDSTYLKSIPSRDEFKWFYGLMMKRKMLDLKKELKVIMDAKKWSKERVVFIANVFFELGFVKIDNGVIQLQQNPVKKDLKTSVIYQKRLHQVEVEKTLFYSTYHDLKKWFTDCTKRMEAPKEEVMYGL
ncbi:single-stranded-DNA-specific exonuclease RecJ [Virgibacillus alimentarius]|uniref:Single-stranded-DNA-specific exonuclease RecJ n=1 Tax=Virgibacillus alimentarius TaxID=698769 RepID=A0ABS4S541_9BACI|nr:single-stranded-DNA-specific exonuclease RecJ [Virgibacillus alimentarius]MBP2256611.1 single-stranded-DNA-specific exonuclease [Virgibacillus alimentarius]